LKLVADAWEQPEYSHGYLIPLFAAVLLWLQREPFEETVPAWHRWCGVGLVCLGIAMRLFGARNVLFTVDYVSFIPCLLGIFVMVGGLNVLRWAGMPIAFLVFMIPLPGFMRDNLLRPLQDWATKASVYALQTLGVEVYNEGTTMYLELRAMNVEEACSGLRMLTIFLALAVAIAMIVTTRPWWERLIIVASAVPIALMVNAIRITITGLLYSLNVNDEFAEMVFHDFAGWIMMPLALGFLYLELHILSQLFIGVSPSAAGPASFVPKSPRQIHS
jgi:exosortase